MKPPLVVGGQDSIRTSLLKTVDEGLQAGNSPSYELGAAEWLQTAVVLHVVLLDQVINTHCGVAICNIEATACREHHVQQIYYCEESNCISMLMHVRGHIKKE